MSYLQHTALGAFSPSQMRVAEAASEVARRRRAGESEDKIFAFLSSPSGLSKISHPCANRYGNNICSPDEISQAISSAAAVGTRQDAQIAAAEKDGEAKAGASAGLLTTRNIVIAGGALAVLLLWKGKKK